MYYMKLHIEDFKGKPSNRLGWESYGCRQFRPGVEPAVSQFDLDSHFKPFFFSPVRSYEVS
jgi:hypothetical protein